MSNGATNIQGRTWLVTRNFREGEELDAEQWLRSFHTNTRAVYTVGQLEQGLKEERKHIQAYVNFSSGKKLGGLKKVDAEAHFDLVKVDNGADRYCMKEITRVAGPWEFGTKPLRRNCAADWDEIKEKAKEGKLDEIPAQILIQNYNALKMIAKDNIKPRGTDHVRGIYIWGKSGAGKTTTARDLFPDMEYYTKTHNKWWDGYKDEPVVLWDDIHPEEGKKSGTALKGWCDRNPVSGESKGSGVALNHEYFIMTSQYPLYRVFEDIETYEAMERRCFVYCIDDDKQLDMKEMFQTLYGGKRPEKDFRIARCSKEEALNSI